MGGGTRAYLQELRSSSAYVYAQVLLPHTEGKPVLPHLALLASLHNRLEDVRRVRSLGDLFAELAKHMDAPKPAGARGNQLFSPKVAGRGARPGEPKPLDELARVHPNSSLLRSWTARRQRRSGMTGCW